MDKQPDLKAVINAWINSNRDRLPLNSLCWKPLFFSTGSKTEITVSRLGKYQASCDHADFFYKPISRII